MEQYTLVFLHLELERFSSSPLDKTLYCPHWDVHFCAGGCNA